MGAHLKYRLWLCTKSAVQCKALSEELRCDSLPESQFSPRDAQITLTNNNLGFELGTTERKYKENQLCVYSRASGKLLPLEGKNGDEGEQRCGLSGLNSCARCTTTKMICEVIAL